MALSLPEIVTNTMKPLHKTDVLPMTPKINSYAQLT